MLFKPTNLVGKKFAITSFVLKIFVLFLCTSIKSECYKAFMRRKRNQLFGGTFNMAAISNWRLLNMVESCEKTGPHCVKARVLGGRNSCMDAAKAGSSAFRSPL